MVVKTARLVEVPSAHFAEERREPWDSVSLRVFLKRKLHWRTDQIHWRGRQPVAEGDPPKPPTGKKHFGFAGDSFGVFWGYGRSVMLARHTLRSRSKISTGVTEKSTGANQLIQL